MASEQAPPARPPSSVPSRRDGSGDAALLGDIRSTSPYFPIRGAVRRAASIAALVILDLIGLVLGLYGALALRELVYGNGSLLWGFLWNAETDWLPFLTLITVLVFWQAGLYAERERRGGFGRIVASLTLVAVITLIFARGSGHPFGTYGLAPTAVILTSICIGLLRGSYDVVTGDLLKLAGVRRRAILVGEGESLARLRRTLGASRGGIDYDFVGAVAISSDGAGLPVLGNLASLPTVLAQRGVDELIVTDSDFTDRELIDIVEQAHRRGVKVRVAPRATELLIERRGEYVPGQGVPLFELRPPVFAGADWVVKRGFDWVVSAVLVIVGLPFWLLIALAIKLDSPGPVFFRDRRVGLNEQDFGMIKFRTMYADAEAQQADLEAENEAEGALFKIRDDPRVTRVGKVLRRFSIDEIPQVLNVLRGEMSLVGPRPLPVRDYELLEPWHRKRYLEHWSIWLDVSILLKTIPAVLGSRGAY